MRACTHNAGRVFVCTGSWKLITLVYVLLKIIILLFFPSARDLYVSLIFSASRIQFGYLLFWDHIYVLCFTCFSSCSLLNRPPTFLMTFDTVAALYSLSAVYERTHSRDDYNILRRYSIYTNQRTPVNNALEIPKF